MLSFFPRGVLDEILNLIESVSEDFPSYSFAPDFQCWCFCESPGLFYLRLIFDFYVSKIMHL